MEKTVYRRCRGNSFWIVLWYSRKWTCKNVWCFSVDNQRNKTREDIRMAKIKILSCDLETYVERHKAECGKWRYLKKRSNSRVNDDELFTRLFYYGTAQLHLASEEVWLMPFGFLLDLWECHKQFMGIAKPKREMCIDEVVPVGIWLEKWLKKVVMCCIIDCRE